MYAIWHSLVLMFGWLTKVVQIGWDQLTIRADLVSQPIDPASGKVIDTSQLSVAVTQLILTP